MKKLSTSLLLLLTCSSLYTPQTKAISQTLSEFLQSPGAMVLEGITGATIIIVTWIVMRKESIETAKERAAIEEGKTAALKEQSNIDVRKQEALNKADIEHRKQKQELETQDQKRKEQKQFEQRVQEAQQLVKRIGTQYTCTAGANDLEKFAKENYNAINYKTPHLLFYNDVKKDLESLIAHQPFLSKQDFEPIHNFLNGIYQGLNQHHGETITKQQYHKRDAEFEVEQRTLALKQAQKELAVEIAVHERVKQEQKILEKIENNANKFDTFARKLDSIKDDIVIVNNNVVNGINNIENTLKNRDFWNNIFNVIDQSLEHQKQSEFRKEQRDRWTEQDKQNEQILRQVKDAISLMQSLYNRPPAYNPEFTNQTEPAPSYYYNPNKL